MKGLSSLSRLIKDGVTSSTTWAVLSSVSAWRIPGNIGLSEFYLVSATMQCQLYEIGTYIQRFREYLNKRNSDIPADAFCRWLVPCEGDDFSLTSKHPRRVQQHW